jgi:para-aminobenzoate synthetase component I
MLKTENIDIDQLTNLSVKLIEFARNFDLACILDNHSEISEFSGPYQYNEFDLIAGFSKIYKNSRIISDFNKLDNLTSPLNDWYFGFLTYDLKNSIEALKSDLPDLMQWPEMLLFVPDILIIKKGRSVTYSVNTAIFPDFDIHSINTLDISEKETINDLCFTSRMSKKEYIDKTEIIKRHIDRGDIYEVNFCQEFHSECNIDPYLAYMSLSEYSPSPFAAFLKVKDKFLLSASPERFLKKKGDMLISQPIKGTAKRSTNIQKDLNLKNSLKSDQKERSENIMIVDLVRNDLSRIAKPKSVKVNELCEVYSFPQVHQMISTISGESNTSSIKDIIKATFPMGSMTGAPKIEAMKIIERFETVKRGIYSGSVGYITPSGDFDFNVVIRSLQYNAENNYVSYLAGSALTSLSDSEKEYEECILKTYALKEAFKQPANAGEIFK